MKRLGMIGVLLGTLPFCVNADVTREVITTSLVAPLYMTAPLGDVSRLFVGEQNGIIRIINKSTQEILSTPFLDISSEITLLGEGGLLSFAFHPNYSSNGYFYVHYTTDMDPGPGVQLGTRISRLTVSANPDVADASSETVFLEVVQPYTNHKGGMLAFRPGDANNYLYISLGDGGNQCDPSGRGQDISEKLASILRIDVDAGPSGDVENPFAPSLNPFVGVDGDDTIWDFGLRNPYRFSFDRLTSDLFIADVGGDGREELDFEPATSSGGRNYGWSSEEGTLVPPRNCGPIVAVSETADPIYEYDHYGSPAAIIGGYVYRGAGSPALYGRYFFSDYMTKQVWSCLKSGDGIIDLQEHTYVLNPNGFGVTSFGEDATGELYMMDFLGTLIRISDADTAIHDYDQDQIADGFETDTGIFVNDNNSGTDPGDPDSDDDGVLDGIEVSLGTDPTDAASVPASLRLNLTWLGVTSIVVLICSISAIFGSTATRASIE